MAIKHVTREGNKLLIHSSDKRERLFKKWMKEINATYNYQRGVYTIPYTDNCWRRFLVKGFLIPDYVRANEEEHIYMAKKVRSIKLPENITKNLFKYQVTGVKYLEAGFNYLGDEMGIGKCLADSYILTSKGIKFINDITDTDGFSKAAFNTVGLKNIESVSDLYRERVNQTRKVKLDNGNTIEGTLKHPLYCLTKEGFKWIKLNDIKKDYIVVSRSGTELYGKKYDNYYLGKVMGYLIANGSGKKLLCFDTRNSQIANDFILNYKNLFNDDLKFNIKNSIHVHKRQHDKIIEYYGHEWETARYKKIPKCVLEGSKITQLGFLQAMFDCDSYFNGHTLELSSASEKVVKGIYTMLVNMGIKPWIREKYLEKYDWNYFMLYIDRIDITKLYSQESIKYGDFGFKGKCNPNKKTWVFPKEIYPRPLSPCNATLRRGRRLGYITDFISNLYITNYNDKESLFYECCRMIKEGYFFNKVVDIKDMIKDKYVYDIVVPQSHSFLANGVVSHNTVTSLRFLENHPEKKNNLVICPAYMKDKWGSEILKWTSRKIQIINGQDEIKLEQDKVYIINFDILQYHVKNLKKAKLGFIFVDEAHLCGATSNIRVKALNKINKKAERLIAISGTPLTNNSSDLFSVARLVAPLEFYDKRCFENTFCVMSEKFNKPVGSKNDELLNYILKKGTLVRRLYKDVKGDFGDSYKTTVNSKIIRIDIINRLEYDEENRKLTKIMKEDYVSAQNRLQRPRILKDIIYEGKKQFIFDWVDKFLKSGRKICLFFMSTAHLEEFYKRYEKKAMMMNGKTPSKKRFLMSSEFNKNPKIKVFCGNIRACSTGIDLIGSYNVGFVDFDWNFGNMNQAYKRCDRFGQESPVINVYYFAGKNTVETTEFLDKIDKKNSNFANVIDGRRLLTEEKFSDNFGQRK